MIPFEFNTKNQMEELKMNKNHIKSEKNKIFFENVGNSSKLNCEYIIEAQNPHQKFLNEEKTVMLDTKLIVNQFKKKVRVSLYNLRVNIYKADNNQEEREILSDENYVLESEVYDDYSFLENQIIVMDFKMTIKNDLLYEVLSSMEQQHRDIAYLSLCEDWSDSQIGERLNLSRSKVQRIKQKLKKEIYSVMTGGIQNEDKTQKEN